VIRPDDMIIKPSRHSVAVTLDRLEAALKKGHHAGCALGSRRRRQ